MPNPAIIAAAVTAGGQLINSGIQGGMNRATRKWNERMYSKQREDALADWARTNEYNSPLQQMQRLKAAGLNPNLVYNNGATHSAQAVQKTDMKQWSPQAPQFDFGQIADQYFGAQQRQTTINVGEQQVKALQLENINKEIKNVRDAKGLPYVEPQLQANLAKTVATTDNIKANTALSLGRDAREAIRTTADVELAAKRALQTEQDTILKKAQTANTQEQLKNIRLAQTLIEEQGNLAKLNRIWKEYGLTDESSRVEWLIAQFAMDPVNANNRLQNYLDAVGKLAKGGAQQTGKKLKELWSSIFGD
jgi:hypothetical protein